MKFRFVKKLVLGAMVGMLALGSGVVSMPAMVVEAAEDETQVDMNWDNLSPELQEAVRRHMELEAELAESAKHINDPHEADTRTFKSISDEELFGTSATATQTEGTDNSLNFDAVYYAQTNPDVVALLGTDKDVLYNHYVMFGKAEGRRACAVVFDAEYYAKTNPDVVAVFGTDKDALYNHYVTYGKAEGRRACADNVK